jgi:hypothetical protein
VPHSVRAQAQDLATALVWGQDSVRVPDSESAQAWAAAMAPAGPLVVRLARVQSAWD